MSSWNFVLSWVEHEKSFITPGPVQWMYTFYAKYGNLYAKRKSLVFQILENLLLALAINSIQH